MLQTFTPIEYLKIDVANSYGLDKEDWDTRIAWFDENEHQLDLLEDKAEEPAMYFAGVQAYHKAKAGQSISYPISLDATASGAQILSVLIGCRKSASLCNVIDTGHREDLYTNGYELMKTRLPKSQLSNISRKDAKTAIMTSLYGSEAEPKNIFGEGSKLAAFYQTMEEDMPGIWKLNKILLALWNPTSKEYGWILPDNFHVKVKVMDNMEEEITFRGENHVVETKVNRPTLTGRSTGANLVHSIDGMIVREILRRCNYDKDQVDRVWNLLATASSHSSVAKPPKGTNAKMVSTLLQHYQFTGFLSARIIDYIDEETIRMFSPINRQAVMDVLNTFAEKPFPVITVHDCFRVHPNYGNDLRRMYNQLLHEISKSSLLAYLTTQLTGIIMKVDKIDDISADVLEANYALS